MRYIPITEKDEKEMLASIGVNSIEELFSEIPENLKMKKELPLPKALAEAQLKKHLTALSNQNANLDELVSFLGAGAYEHFIPSIVDHLSSRGEFLTAYTPYQAEVSQGVLQSIFEFQTMIAELTGMEAANASMYDGATALAEAALMACNVTRRNTVLIPKSLHPEWQEVVTLYLESQNIEVVVLPYDLDSGSLKLPKGPEEVFKSAACLVVQQPNFFGVIEDAEYYAEQIHQHGGLFVMAVDPITLGLLKSPGECGADIVVGDAQALGNPVSFGGPSVGFFAIKGSKLLRRMPGRIVGITEDADGDRGFVLTLQTREQHIRREKATSNICSNQALMALRTTIYLSVVGKQGLKDVSYQCLQKAAYLRKKLEEIGVRVRFSGPVFREFVAEAQADWIAINEKLLEKGFLGGLPLVMLDPSLKNCVLLAVSETRTKEEIDAFVAVLGGMIK
ncbi:MAG: aminomethyl-transferring glycine dehydrogenase subunit GcvPA [Firmicutes bacterium]|jgi:glycine dehydrogenase subunit 1|nr:aminomethyl-transferring glycine dehydrogenase subunit GcvPA [Bacillota bacterium]